jgi:hypothetical protein
MKDFWPDYVKCKADQHGLKAFQIDGDQYHAESREEADRMHLVESAIAKQAGSDGIKLDANQLEWDSL